MVSDSIIEDTFRQPSGDFKRVFDSLFDGVYVLNTDRKIIYWNPSAERLTGYTEEAVLGRCCADNILSHIDAEGTSLCRGRCPMAAAMADGQEKRATVYLHHRDGHRVPVEVKAVPLHNRDKKIIGAVEIFKRSDRDEDAVEEVAKLRRLALIDELTEVGNRRYVRERLTEMFNESLRHSWPFGILFVDIDNFKSFNDQFGHATGDRVLRMVSQTMANGLRSYDLVGRWGGEEFVCVLKHVGEAELTRVAEKVRVLIERSSLEYQERELSVTVSIGATLAAPDENVDELLDRADQALYESKKAGRNRVTIA